MEGVIEFANSLVIAVVAAPKALKSLVFAAHSPRYNHSLIGKSRSSAEAGSARGNFYTYHAVSEGRMPGGSGRRLGS
jgi:hypothetical protein